MGWWVGDFGFLDLTLFGVVALGFLGRLILCGV